MGNGPLNDGTYEILTPKGRVSGYAMNTDGGVGVVLFPDLHVGKGRSPNAGYFAFDLQFPLMVFGYFSFYHFRIEIGLDYYSTYFAVVSNGMAVEREDGR